MFKSRLELTRPIIGLDVETHAKVPPEKARICQISVDVEYHDGRPNKKWTSLINPGVKIHEDTTKIHGITNEMVKGAKPFSTYAEQLARGFRIGDFAGYNVRFDLAVVAAEMKRARVDCDMSNARLLDGLRLWQVAKPRTLTDAVREFCDREPTKAHDAEGDTRDAIDVILGILDRFDHLPRDVQQLHDLSFPSDPNRIGSEGKFGWIDNEPCVTFGKKHNGTPMRIVTNVDPGFWQWMLKAEFTPETKKIAQDAADGVYPTR